MLRPYFPDLKPVSLTTMLAITHSRLTHHLHGTTPCSHNGRTNSLASMQQPASHTLWAACPSTRQPLPAPPPLPPRVPTTAPEHPSPESPRPQNGRQGDQRSTASPISKLLHPSPDIAPSVHPSSILGFLFFRLHFYLFLPTSDSLVNTGGSAKEKARWPGSRPLPPCQRRYFCASYHVRQVSSPMLFLSLSLCVCSDR